MPQKKRKQRNCGSVMPNAVGGVGCDEGRKKDREDFVDRVSTDPRLDAEPAARDERAHQCWNIRAPRAERGAAENREWNSITRPGVRVQDHRNEHDEIAEENRHDRLPPIHPATDQRRREHVSRNAGRHRNPERGITRQAPGAALRRHRRKIGVVEASIWHFARRGFPRAHARDRSDSLE